MQSKNTVIGIVVVVIVLIVGIGGYIAGRRSGGERAGNVYNNGGAAKVVSRPTNHSSLVSDLEAKLKEKPDDTDALQTLADTYFAMKRFDDAIKYYKKIAALSPENVDVYNEIGLALHYKGESGEALKYVEKGLKKNPYHQRMWLTKGFILAYGVGDLKDAAKAWEKARALDPASNVGKAAADYLVQINKEDGKK